MSTRQATPKPCTPTRARLSHECSHERQAEPPELVVPDELVQVEPEQLKHQAQVPTEHEKVLGGRRAGGWGCGGLRVGRVDGVGEARRGAAAALSRGPAQALLLLLLLLLQAAARLQAHDVMRVAGVCPCVEVLQHPHLHARLQAHSAARIEVLQSAHMSRYCIFPYSVSRDYSLPTWSRYCICPCVC